MIISKYLKNKKIKKSLYTKFLSDFQNVGTKKFVRSSISNSMKKTKKKQKKKVKNYGNIKIWVFLGFLAKIGFFDLFFLFFFISSKTKLLILKL